MVGFVLDVLDQALAEVVSVVLAALAVYAAAHMFWRRRVRRFFGVTPARGAIGVFLSCIDVRPGGAVGTEAVSGGSQGTSINYLEYRAALALAAAVQARPLVRALHALRPAEWQTAEPVICRIEPGPSGLTYQQRMADHNEAAVVDEVRRRAGAGPVVLVGSVIYNVMTKVMTAGSGIAFLHEVTESVDAGGSGSGSGADSGGGGGSVPGRRSRRGIGVEGPAGFRDFWRTVPERDGGPLTDYFVVAALTWQGRRVFLCAGTSTAGTTAAVRRLASWRTLRAEFGDAPFTTVYELRLENAAALEMEPPASSWQRVYRDPPERA